MGIILMGNLWLGIGCQRGTTAIIIEQAIAQLVTDRSLDLGLFMGLGTVDRKAQEPGILAVCQTKQWQLRLFTAAELAVVTVPNPAMVVQAQVGTPSVAEAAALLAAGSGSQLLVSKQIYRLAGTALAIAVARAADRMNWC